MKLRILFAMLLSLGAFFVNAETTKPSYSQIIDHPQQQVVVFTTSWCGYCKLVKNFLDEEKIDYINYDIEANLAAKALYDRLETKGVPLIVTNDRLIVGYQPELIKASILKP